MVPDFRNHPQDTEQGGQDPDRFQGETKSERHRLEPDQEILQSQMFLLNRSNQFPGFPFTKLVDLNAFLVHLLFELTSPELDRVHGKRDREREGFGLDWKVMDGAQDQEVFRAQIKKGLNLSIRILVLMDGVEDCFSSFEQDLETLADQSDFL